MSSSEIGWFVLRFKEVFPEGSIDEIGSVVIFHNVVYFFFGETVWNIPFQSVTRVTQCHRNSNCDHNAVIAFEVCTSFNNRLS